MPLQTTSAFQLLQERQKYSTQSTIIDELTEGGLTTGSILEIAGPPGCGREGILLGLVRSALLNGDDVIFYGSQGSIQPFTLNNVQTACYACYEERGSSASEKPAIHYLHVGGMTALLIALNRLNDVVKSNPRIRLIVFETLSLNIDATIPDTARSYHLKQLGRVLSKTCTARSIACAFSTNLSTRMIGADGNVSSFNDSEAKAIMTPQLGDLGINTLTRVVLRRTSLNSGTAHKIVPNQKDRSQGKGFQIEWKDGIASPL